MDAKTRDLALLAFLSLLCGSAFFALGVVAMLGAAYRQRR